MSIILKILLIFAILRPIRGCCINIEDNYSAVTSPSYPTITYTIRKTTTKTTTTTTKAALPSRRPPPTVKKTTTLTTTTTTIKVRPFTLDDADFECKKWKSEALHSFQVSILMLLSLCGAHKMIITYLTADDFF